MVKEVVWRRCKRSMPIYEKSPSKLTNFIKFFTSWQPRYDKLVVETNNSFIKLLRLNYSATNLNFIEEKINSLTSDEQKIKLVYETYNKLIQDKIFPPNTLCEIVSIENLGFLESEKNSSFYANYMNEIVDKNYSKKYMPSKEFIGFKMPILKLATEDLDTREIRKYLKKNIGSVSYDANWYHSYALDSDNKAYLIDVDIFNVKGIFGDMDNISCHK
jgi:hypothetical protein